MSWWELVGYLAGAASVGLFVVRSAWAWPTAMLNAICWFALFWSAGLYAGAALHLAVVAVQLVGGIVWARGSVVPTSTPRVELAGLAGGSALAVAAVWNYGPTAVLALLLLAVAFLLVRVRSAAWWWWMAADLVAMWVYAEHEFYVSALVQPFFIGLCVVGWRRWRSGRPTVHSEQTPDDRTKVPVIMM